MRYTNMEEGFDKINEKIFCQLIIIYKINWIICILYITVLG